MLRDSVLYGERERVICREFSREREKKGKWTDREIEIYNIREKDTNRQRKRW